MEISPTELFNVISYFIEITMLVRNNSTKYQAYYLMFLDLVIDTYSEEIKRHIYKSCDDFCKKYSKLQTPESMSPQLCNIIYHIYSHSLKNS